MNDLTEGFRIFRELARVVWNCGLRVQSDGEHEFVAAQEALFTAMVASQATKELVDTEVNGIRYYPQIRVIPSVGLKMGTLVGYDEAGYINWKAEELTLSTDLRFGRVFDFITLDGEYRDFRHIFCADVGDPQNIRRVLIDAHDIMLFEVPDEQQATSSRS